MFGLLIAIVIIICALANFKKLLGLLLQCVVSYIGFCIHPIIGGFLVVVFILHWLGPKEKPKEYKQEERKEYKQEYQEEPKQQTYPNKYFTGCNNKADLKKRHRELCMKYHPDKGGNIEIFKEMQAEYESIIKNY